MSVAGRLAGKVALVTGGGRGLGRGIALGFAAEGAKIVVNFVRDAASADAVVAQIKSNGGAALAVQADVGEAGPVEAMVKATIAEFGTIDILVNNAGLLNSMRLDAMPISVWDEMLQTHLRGMFLCTRFTIPYMVAQKSGHIINMTGTFGVTGAAEFTHMSAAKAGMIGFTKALAKEVGPDGVYVNAIAPAIIRTDLYNHMPTEVRDSIVATYPLRRVGEVEDVVACAMFLATKESAFVTGQTISPSGGEVMI
jgi:3-oxoacyl-[acyl-carrier protein] reductase